MEAGLEHLSRSEGTLRFVDTLLIVTEPYRKALITAQRTHRLASDLGIGHIAIVANKVRDDSELDELQSFADSESIPVIGVVPFDEAARDADRAGAALVDFAPDSPAVKAIATLLKEVESQWDAQPVAT